MIWLFGLAAVCTWALTGGYLAAMTRRGRLDVPNARSMHQRPKPSGAGIVAVPIAVAGWLWMLPTVPAQVVVLSLAALPLSGLGWLDDMRGLPVRVRFAAQIAAIVAVLLVLPSDARLAPVAPLWIERLMEALAWCWFVNLFNFMDGIDGLAGSEAVAAGAGYVAVAGISALGGPLGALIAAVMLGYLLWNWAPGRLMMGDAGSIPLGFLIGWLMLDLAFRGHGIAAVIIPAYFCVDATVTLLSRLWRGKHPSEAHREHFYQRAALGCGSHALVVTGVAGANAGLIAMALVSQNHPAAGLAGALAILLVLFAWLSRLQAGKPQAV